jgi:hypothetical protein
MMVREIYYLPAPFGERLSLPPCDRFSRNTCVAGVKRFTPNFLKLIYHNNHPSLEGVEGGVRGFLVLVFNGLR